MSKPILVAFLSTPYESYPHGLQRAYDDAAALVLKLMDSQPFPVFSPVVYCHHIAMARKIDPRDRPFWMARIRPHMEGCGFQIVAHMDNWENSPGIAEETGYFESVGRRVKDLNPRTLFMVDRAHLKPPRDRIDGMSHDEIKRHHSEWLQGARV